VSAETARSDGKGDGRIERRFARLRSQGRAGLVTFTTAGDPDRETAQAILDGLPGAGADLIELGMPFSDPMADGPTIQAAGQRALRAGQDMVATLDMVRAFRAGDDETPLILMGYFNPIYRYGVGRFVADARTAGVDGLIVVDLPPEEAAELAEPARAAGLAPIALVAPTTDESRLGKVLAGARGFVYTIAVAGITGTRSAALKDVDAMVARLRRHTELPIAVGFGVKTPEDAAGFARVADAVVVGSALVETIAGGLDKAGRPGPRLAADAHAFVGRLAEGVRRARERAA